MKKETLLPKNIEQSKELSKNAKRLLDYFILWNGTDQAKENGYFFRSNNDIENDLKIHTMTLIRGLRELISLGLITREVGFRNNGVKQASKYTLNVEAINNFDASAASVIDIISNNYNNNYSHNIKAGSHSKPSNILDFHNSNVTIYILGDTNEKK